MAGEVRLSLVTNVTVAGLLFDSLRFYRALGLHWFSTGSRRQLLDAG